VDDCITSGSYRIQDISLLQNSHNHQSTTLPKPFPFSKETHVYFIHNDDPSTLSKLTLMVTLLSIHGYKCFTTQDIPPGENILVMANKACKNSISTAVVDFCYLNKIQSAVAEFVSVESIKGKTKFIPVLYNSSEQTFDKPCVGEFQENLTTPLDVTDHHTEWLPKLLTMLQLPFDHQKGISYHFKGGNEQVLLAEIKRIAKKMRKTINQLQTKAARYAVYLLIKDDEFVRFANQAESYAKNKQFFNSHPPAKSGRRIQKVFALL